MLERLDRAPMRISRSTSFSLLFTALGLMSTACRSVPASGIAGPPLEVGAGIDLALDELIERSNTHRSFRAVYRRDAAGAEAQIEIVYQYPDRARLHRRDGEGETVFQIADGWLELWSPETFASVDMGAIDRRFRSTTRLLAELLAEPAPRRERQSGPHLHLWERSSDAGRTGEEALRPWLRWDLDRAIVLPWLAELRGARRLESASDELVYEPGPDMRVVLDIESGFPKVISFAPSSGSGEQLELVSLELNPELELADFELGLPTEGRRDDSEAVAREVIRLETDALRRRLYLASGELDPLVLREGFRLVHEAAIDRALAPWVEACEGWIADAAAQAATARENQLVESSEIRRLVSGREREFERNLGRAVKEWVRFPAPAGVAQLGEDRVTELLGIERQVAQKAFEARITAPLRARYADAIRRTP